ncbi:unnamed protein product [Toxocara canis]|uniref:LARP2 n=1 Tax=Toxocara canis TaxID=6265 RepID=A0A183U3T1_TOXCA|nr:unnamed protein product [Toxocara canis]
MMHSKAPESSQTQLSDDTPADHLQPSREPSFDRAVATITKVAKRELQEASTEWSENEHGTRVTSNEVASHSRNFSQQNMSTTRKSGASKRSGRKCGKENKTPSQESEKSSQKGSKSSHSIEKSFTKSTTKSLSQRDDRIASAKDAQTSAEPQPVETTQWSTAPQEVETAQHGSVPGEIMKKQRGGVAHEVEETQIIVIPKCQIGNMEWVPVDPGMKDGEAFPSTDYTNKLVQ